MTELSGEFGYVVQNNVSVEPDNAECIESDDVVELTESIVMFRNRNVGQHENVFEGEVRSSVYGARPCVIKFAEIPDQNVREAEILTKLGSHTNVVAIIQSGTYRDVFEERVYIALDKCHNENLRQYLVNKNARGIEFDLNQAIDFAKQIIAGVMYIHDNNVIHLDLKPSNILISQNLKLIKIADFGLSIVVMSPKSKVFHKHQFGTNGYRPIESFGNGEVSMRTDIFSLGTVLKHLLSNGNDVFGCDEHIFIHNVMNDATDMSGLLVSNPLATEHLIKCMVSKERCRRPSIWEVCDHPCWSGKEVERGFEYFCNDEVYDDEADESEDIKENAAPSQSDIDRGREFLKAMKEMGFERKPTIVLFDDWKKQLYRFDHKSKSLTKMHKYPFWSISTMSMFTPATSFGEYIYSLEERVAYRLEYGDADASWQIMNMNVPGEMFHYVASSTDLYFVEQYFLRDKKVIVTKYIPSTKQWQRLNDKPTPAYETALHCNDEFLYCFGGYIYDTSFKSTVTNVVERMDLKTTEWSRIADLTEGRYVTSAAECNDKIYTIGDDNLEQVVIPFEMYDPKVNQWTQLKSIHDAFLTRFFIISVDDNLLLMSSKWETDKRLPEDPFDDDVLVAKIHSYNFAENQWEVLVPELPEMHIQDAVVVQMAA